MTYEELADLTSDKLESLNDKQLEEILKPFFPETRPEIVQVSRSNIRTNNNPSIIISKEKQEALKLLAAEGYDMTHLLKNRRRR